MGFKFVQHSPAGDISSRQSGFTLIELLVVLAIVGVLLFIATPNYNSVMSGSKVDKQKLEVATSIALARSEAVKRGALVRMCSAFSGDCKAETDDSGNESWASGWSVTVVEDGTLLRNQQGIAEGVTFYYTCGKFIEFNAAGARTSSTSTNECEFRLGIAGDSSFDSAISINLTGRTSLQ